MPNARPRSITNEEPSSGRIQQASGQRRVRSPKIRYRAGAFPMGDGKQVIAADFSKPERMVIFDPSTGKAN
jgi:hypothetical protein